MWAGVQTKLAGKEKSVDCSRKKPNRLLVVSGSANIPVEKFIGGTMRISEKIVVQLGASLLLFAGSAANACDIWVQIGPKRVCQQRVPETTYLLDKQDVQTLQRLQAKSDLFRLKLNSLPPTLSK
jgi:hypothetical protein